MICKPDGVVMAFPALWADAVVAMITGVETAAAIAATAVLKMVRREDRIFLYLSSVSRTCLAQQNSRCHPVTHRKRPGWKPGPAIPS
jgi:hypothetical protein